MKSCSKIILWTGPKHSGKTTEAAVLFLRAIKADFNVAGVLALPLYNKDKLAGFEIMDLHSGNCQILARRTEENKAFSFSLKGLRLGQKVLTKKTTNEADLIIVDEFGPLEIAGKGWRKCVDNLLSKSPALLLLVVRKELVKKVEQLYKYLPIRKVNASDKSSIQEVLTMLKDNKKILDEVKKHSKSKRISCASCFNIADKLDVPLKTIGRLCNENKIRISYCQLGCFK
jgi:nucleoside-triphosphatase THEP1